MPKTLSLAMSELLRRDRWTAADAQRILELWPSAELSLSAFARRHGVDPRRLYWWRGRLRLRQTASAAISFEEVKVPRTTTEGTGTDTAAFEVVLRSGLVLRVGNSFDEVALRRLMSVLEPG